MKKIFLISAIALQAFTLIFIATEREFIVRFGKNVRLRTAPVDPRDPFRGDFVALNYEISSIPSNMLVGKMPEDEALRKSLFYVVLKPDADGVWSAESCHTEKPSSDKVFIKGRIDRTWSSGDNSIQLRYGIEKFFVQQNKGLEIEERARGSDNIRIPLEVNVALGKNGTAVAKSLQWCPVGIGLEVLEAPENRNNFNRSTAQNDDDQNRSNRQSPKIKIKLQNCSDKKIALVNLPDYASFTVHPSRPSSKEWNFIHKPSPSSITDSDVSVLAPGEQIESVFDFAETRWFVKDENGNPCEIGKLSGRTWSDMLRIHYNAPLPEQCLDLKNAELIWHGNIMSPNFSPSGYID